jgi:hypothetical protein
MKIIIIAFLIIFKIGFSQADKSEFKGVSIEREYTAQNYVQPDSILFYSSDHWELERYYEILFKKLKKQFKKTEVFTKFTFEKNDSTSIRVSSFEGMNYNINTKDANAICVFALSKIDTNTSRINKKTGQTLFINKKRILFYDLFMILIL